MQRCGELEASPEVREKLLRISAATIDRLLASERARLRVKGRRSGTKPGSILKRQIPIRTTRRYAPWSGYGSARPCSCPGRSGSRRPSPSGANWFLR
jgi:hypothetical protein